MTCNCGIKHRNKDVKAVSRNNLGVWFICLCKSGCFLAHPTLDYKMINQVVRKEEWSRIFYVWGQ